MRRSGSCNFNFLKNSLVQINSKLKSTPYDYLYKLHSTQFNYHCNIRAKSVNQCKLHIIILDYD